MRREEQQQQQQYRKLQYRKLAEERDTTKHLRRAVESSHLKSRGALAPTRNQLVRAEGAHTQRAEREEQAALLQHLRGGDTVAGGGGSTHRVRVALTPRSPSREAVRGRPASGSWPASARGSLSLEEDAPDQEGGVETLLEQVIMGGEATLSAATAKLARDKLKSAEAQAAEARHIARGEVERLRKQMHGTVEEKMAVRFAEMRAARAEELHCRSAVRLRMQGCLRAFVQWQQKTATRNRIWRTLRVAAVRLVKPKLVRGMADWCLVWSERKRQKWLLRIGEGLMHGRGPESRLPHIFSRWASSHACLSTRRQLRRMEAKYAEDRLDAQQLQVELRKAREHEQMALARLEAEISGTSEEQMAARATREKEARIDDIAKRAVRRIKHGGMVRGWNTWFEGYCARMRMQRMLASSVARLQRPLLSAAVSKWKHDWSTTQLSASRLSGDEQVGRAVAEVRAQARERRSPRSKRRGGRGFSS